MKFSISKIAYETNTQIEVIHFEVDEYTRQNALEIAKKKAPYTMKWSVSDFVRDKKRHLNNLWQGKIADKAAMQWLELQGLKIEEYDQIRADNFKHPDPWDLRVIPSNIEMEVRSSCLAKATHDMAHVIRSYKILGPYTIPGFKEAERAKYLHIQVIYPYIQSLLNQELEMERKVEGYIVGWMSRDELMKRGFDWVYRETDYKVILIKDGRRMLELIDFLDKARLS